MRKLITIVAAAATLLTPLASSAQGRGDGRGEGRWRNAERHADRNEARAAAREARGRDYDRRDMPPPGFRRQPGPPPQARGGWGRGQYLPPTYRGAPVRDIERYRLRQPPMGYDWVRVGPDIYLTQRSTGLVVEAIPGGR